MVPAARVGAAGREAAGAGLGAPAAGGRRAPAQRPEQASTSRGPPESKGTGGDAKAQGSGSWYLEYPH